MILGTAVQITALRAQIQRLASFDAPGNPHVPTVLLQGETGTGKGLVARVIHDGGPRSSGPFVDVNCAAIPEAMLEAELFGFEAGAFTDAKRAKPGLFEAASSGTLFLDEIDSLSPPVQSKVLKAIEEKRVRRLGAVTPCDIDVKLIAATQKDLAALVAAGAFRADLYHRLSVFTLGVPPLRELEGDKLLLLEHYRRFYAEQSGVQAFSLDAAAERRWLDYPFPGNVRELRNIVIRLTTKHPGRRLAAADLEPEFDLEGSAPADTAPGEGDLVAQAVRHLERSRGVELDRLLAAMERGYIEAALRLTRGNVSQAAKLLGVNRTTLYSRMGEPKDK